MTKHEVLNKKILEDINYLRDELVDQESKDYINSKIDKIFEKYKDMKPIKIFNFIIVSSKDRMFKKVNKKLDCLLTKMSIFYITK